MAEHVHAAYDPPTAQSGPPSHATGAEQEHREWEAKPIQQGASEGTRETKERRRIDKEVVTDLIHHLFSPHTAGEVPASTVKLVSPHLTISFPFLPAPAPPFHGQSGDKDNECLRISSLSQQALALFRLPARIVNDLSFAKYRPEVYNVEETTLAVAVPEHEKGKAKEEHLEIVEKWSAELEWVFEVRPQERGEAGERHPHALGETLGTRRAPGFEVRSQPCKVELVFTSRQPPSSSSHEVVQPAPSLFETSAFDIPHNVTSEVDQSTSTDLIAAAGEEEHDLVLTHARYLFAQPVRVPLIPSYLQDAAISLAIALVGYIVPVAFLFLKAVGFGDLASVTTKTPSRRDVNEKASLERRTERRRAEASISVPASTAVPRSSDFEREYEEPSRRSRSSRSRSSSASQPATAESSTNPGLHSALRRSERVHRRRASTAPSTSASTSSATLTGEEPHHVHFASSTPSPSGSFAKVVNLVQSLLLHVRQTLDDITALAWTIRQIVLLVTEFLGSLLSVGKDVLQGEGGEEARAHGVKRRRSSAENREGRGRSRQGGTEKRAKHYEGGDVGDEADVEEEEDNPKPTSHPMVRSPDLRQSGFSVEKHVAFAGKRSVSAPPAPVIPQLPFARPSLARRASSEEPDGEPYIPPTDPAHHDLPSIATADTPLARLHTKVSRQAASRGRSISPVLAEEYTHHGVPGQAFGEESGIRAEAVKEAAELGRNLTGSPDELRAVEGIEEQLEEKRKRLLAEATQGEGEVEKAVPKGEGEDSQFYGLGVKQSVSTDPCLASLPRTLPLAPQILAPPPPTQRATDTASSTPPVLSPFSHLAQSAPSIASAAPGTLSLSLAQKLHALQPGQRRTKEEAIDTPVEPQTPEEGFDEGHKPAPASSVRRKSRDYGFEMSEAMAPPTLRQANVEAVPEEPTATTDKPSRITYRTLAEAKAQAQEGEGETEELEEATPSGKVVTSEEEGTTTPRAGILKLPSTPPTIRPTKEPRSAPTAFTPPSSPTASTFPSPPALSTTEVQTARLIRSHSHPADTDLEHYYSPSSTLLSGSGAVGDVEGAQPPAGELGERSGEGGKSTKDDSPSMVRGEEAGEELEEERAEKAPLRHPLPGGSTAIPAAHEGGQAEGAGGKKKRRKGKRGGKK